MYRRSNGRSSTKGPISWGRLWKAAPYCTRRAITARSNAGEERGRENRGEQQNCSAIRGGKQARTFAAHPERGRFREAGEAAVEGPRGCMQQERRSLAF